MRWGEPEFVDINSIHPPPYSGRGTPIQLLLAVVIPDTIGNKPPILETPPLPIFVNNSGEIIDGVMRWKALKLAGVSQVWIMRAVEC